MFETDLGGQRAVDPESAAEHHQSEGKAGARVEIAPGDSHQGGRSHHEDAGHRHDLADLLAVVPLHLAQKEDHEVTGTEQSDPHDEVEQAAGGEVAVQEGPQVDHGMAAGQLAPEEQQG